MLPWRLMEERSRRIVDTAIGLAELGGFDAVRLREVAARAGVALGTVYKRFPSKEDILVAAIERLVERMEQRMKKTPLEGATPVDRVTSFFDTATRALCRKPNLTRAVLRAMVSGEPARTDKVVYFHGRSTALIVAALRGPEPNGLDYEPVAHILQQVWFAALVGWMGGLHKETQVVEQVRGAAKLLLLGLSAGLNGRTL